MCTRVCARVTRYVIYTLSRRGEERSVLQGPVHVAPYCSRTVQDPPESCRRNTGTRLRVAETSFSHTYTHTRSAISARCMAVPHTLCSPACSRLAVAIGTAQVLGLRIWLVGFRAHPQTLELRGARARVGCVRFQTPLILLDLLLALLLQVIDHPRAASAEHAWWTLNTN